MLHVYKEVDIANKGVLIPEIKDTVILSFDEQPQIETISMTSKNLSLVHGKHRPVTRGYESRFISGTVLSFAFNRHRLHTNIVTGIINKTYNNEVFIAFLKKLDLSYLEEKKIKIILDKL